MKYYWDSSALVQTSVDHALHARLAKEGGISRSHALAETFSAFTGKLSIRVDANAASKMVDELARYLKFVELSPAEILAGLSLAQARGVRGGRVHDYLHALAAAKVGSTLLTADRNDFELLVPGLPIEQV